MLKVKVIADNILNLTDARYFAALGVDYLVFDVEKIDPKSIEEIKQWVEGVNFLLDTKGPLTPQLLELIISLSPEGIVSQNDDVLRSIKEQYSEAVFFLRNKDDQLINVDDSSSKPYIKVDIETTELETIIESTEIAGLIVEGEPEEKVGFKNFDELDEIFEILSD